MAGLDFSRQADPANGLDFSALAEPVRSVGRGESALRGLAGAGGALLNTLDLLGNAFNPGQRVQQAMGLPVEAPLQGLAARAQEYAGLAPDEVHQDLETAVTGGTTRVVPELATAFLGGSAVRGPQALEAAARNVPYVGRALGGMVRGSPFAGAMTAQQAANLPEGMTPGEQVGEVAKMATINTAIAGLPVAVGEAPLVRALSGGGLGLGTSAGLTALAGEEQDAATNIVGTLTGAGLGLMPHARDSASIEEMLRRAWDAMGGDPGRGTPGARRADVAAPDFSGRARAADDIHDAEFWDIPRQGLPTPELVAGLLGGPEAPPPALSGPASRTAQTQPAPAAEAPAQVAPIRAEPSRAPETLPAADAADPGPAEHAIGGIPVVRARVADLALSQDVPQFKLDAREDGVVEPLGGTFDERGVGPIQVWRRNDGRLEVISGRHRLDLARRSGKDTIPAQIYNEADGFTAEQAAILDAELNIRDGQGKVADYVQFFQSPAFEGEAGRQEADARGLLARATGKRAYTIASEGTGELIAAHRAGVVSDQAATEIAHAAPGNGALQALGMKLVQEGKSINAAVNTMRAVHAMRGDAPAENLDLFGFDDSALLEATRMADVAATRQRDIGQRLAAVTGAAKRPELARKEGVDVSDPDALAKRIEGLRAEKARWDKWHLHPDLTDQIRQELGHEPNRTAEQPAASEPFTDTATAPMFAGVESPLFGGRQRGMQGEGAGQLNQGDLFDGPEPADHLDAARRAVDSRMRGGDARQRTDIHAGDGELFAGPRPEQTDLVRQAAPGAKAGPLVGAEPNPASDDAARGDVDARYAADLGRAGKPNRRFVTWPTGALRKEIIAIARSANIDDAPDTSDALKIMDVLAERLGEVGMDDLFREIDNPALRDERRGALLKDDGMLSHRTGAGDDEFPWGDPQTRIGWRDTDPRPAGARGDDAGRVRLRPDATPALTRRGKHEVDALVRRYGGSVLADTIARDFRETQTAQLIGKTASTVEDFAALAQVYRNPLFETLHYVFTDASGEVIGESAVSSRLPASAPSFPEGEGIDWLVARARELGAAGVWVTHNHPSGDPTPSRADVFFTRNLARELPDDVSFLGHVVLNHQTYSSITERGEVGTGKVPGTEGRSDPLRVPSAIDGQSIRGPADAARIGSEVFAQTPENSVALISTTTRGKVSMMTALPKATIGERRAAGLLSVLGRRAGADRHFAVMERATFDQHRELLIEALGRGLLADVVIMEPGGSVRSAAVETGWGGNRISDYQARGSTRSDRGRHVFDRAEPYDVGQGARAGSGETPSRRPGESQRAYAKRVMRKGKEEIKAATALARRQQKIGRHNFRAYMARQARAMDTADAAFAEVRKLFDKTPKEINLATIDQWETGAEVTDLDARDFFDAMQAGFDARIKRIRELAPDALQQLIENYFPHIWEDSGKASKWYQGFTAKSPLQGNRAFLKQRTWGTIKEGMASGLKPVSTNPVDLVLLKYSQMDKFIAFHELRADMEQRGWLKKMRAGERVPDGYARVEDPAFRIAGGLGGYYAVPELVAKDINGYLAPSLYRFGAWKSLRTVQNLLMSARLGWSMFHAGFTTLDNVVQHVGIGAQKLADGDIAGGLTMILRDAPASIVMGPWEGHHYNRMWRGLEPADANTAALLNLLEQGGARWKMSATDYNNALPKIIRSIRQRSATNVMSEILPAIGELSSWIIHHWLVPNQKMAARVTLMKFELDHFAERLGKERGDYVGIIDAMHPDVARQLAAHVVDAVDDRLGQMTYDNQFWNKTAREVAQGAIGAVGWQVGTIRTVTGGVRDIPHLWNPPELVATLDKGGKIKGERMARVSGRLTNLLSLALVMGGLGAITQYLLTGEGPQELKDYFFPKTGRRNADDSPERLQYPTYWMDHYKLATKPLQTASHKIHPSIGMFLEAIKNEDYYGTRIRDEDAPWLEQAAQVGKYVAKGFVPYSFTSTQKAKANDAGIDRMTGSFFGIVNAPASVSRTRFQDFVAERAYAAMPKGSRSQEEADRAALRRDVTTDLRRGREPDWGDMTAQEKRNARRAASMHVPEIRFRRLGISDKLRAYDLATPEERERYRLRAIILNSDPRKSPAFQRLPEDEKQAIAERLRAIRQEGR